jgi:hypothetical protein
LSSNNDDIGQENFHPVFGFPGIVRFSWKTAEKIVEEKGVRLTWEEVSYWLAEQLSSRSCVNVAAVFWILLE